MNAGLGHEGTVIPGRLSLAARCRNRWVASNNLRPGRKLFTAWVVQSIVTLGLCAVAINYARAEDADATLQWARRVELSTPVSGVVAEVLAEVGQRVKKDDVLLRLNTKVREANLEQAKAEVTRRTRLRDEAQRELNRSQELFNATLLSEHEMELARIGNDDAEAEFQKAKAILAHAESELRYSEIRAPFDAIVIQRMAELGQTVATQLNATPLFVVAEADRMIAQAHVSLKRAQAIHKDQLIGIKVGGRQFEGRVQYVDYEPVNAKQGDAQYAVVVAFPIDGAVLRVGQAAKIALP